MASPPRLSSVNLNLLVALDVLIEVRSVTVAAARVGVTQSAMSQSLAQLREILGDPVLVRSGRSMVATPRAEALGPQLSSLLADLNRVLLQQPEFEPAELQRSLVIGTNPVTAFLIGTELYQVLAVAAPKVTVVFDPHGDHVRRLRDGTLHFVLDIHRLQHSGLVSEALFSDSFAPTLRRGHPLAPPEGQPLSYEAWASIPHVVMGTVESGRNPMDDHLASLGLQRTVALRLPSASACARAAAETDLCWNASTIQACRTQRYYPLVAHRLPDAPLVGTGWLSWHERWNADPAHDFLRGAIRDVMADLQSATLSAG